MRPEDASGSLRQPQLIPSDHCYVILQNFGPTCPNADAHRSPKPEPQATALF